jgi:2-polyprenyl-3-methyl-5-hydroxy-6-metoxy-1,4-benzoquinol methylase
MPTLHLTVAELLESVALFKSELARATNFSELSALWSSASFPYSPPANLDPFSASYRQWVIECYDALTGSKYELSNEYSSDKVDARSFQIGYPYVSNDAGVVGRQYELIGQSLQRIKEKPPTRIAELGFGWGHLTLCLAKIGFGVVAVDIDEGFLKRGHRISEFDSLGMEFLHTDFISFSSTVPDERYGAVIFNQSFHHCDDPFQLLVNLRKNVLTEHGCIYFFAEPISRDLSLPWGLRYDGESLWAITTNKWFELGFRIDFFYELIFRAGFWIDDSTSDAPHAGKNYRAVNSAASIGFGCVYLPDDMKDGWHPADVVGKDIFKFSRGFSQLPSLEHSSAGKTYELVFTNFGSATLSCAVTADVTSNFSLTQGEYKTVNIRASRNAVLICSGTFVPHELTQNGDVRVLGVALMIIRITE